MNGNRRVVTKIDSDGKSKVAIDSVPPIVFRPEGTTNVEIAEIWATTNPAEIPSHSSDPTRDNLSFLPEPGESRFRIVTIEPTESFDLSSELHRADLVEYLVVLRGRIRLVLPSGEAVELKTGELIVQEGTEHAWDNPYSESCIIAVILIGTQPFTANVQTS